ncbi:SPOR domain-containing protein [Algicola sagamiensis]|uniref:SPOR domain-containing protein n=1 Tax=Algicola sagamiensis TaxID=163869 RepID=UPI0003774A83|nr:SPOR domain-containing protein [Algicola sagamiensis]
MLDHDELFERLDFLIRYTQSVVFLITQPQPSVLPEPVNLDRVAPEANRAFLSATQEQSLDIISHQLFQQWFPNDEIDPELPLFESFEILASQSTDHYLMMIQNFDQLWESIQRELAILLNCSSKIRVIFIVNEADRITAPIRQMLPEPVEIYCPSYTSQSMLHEFNHSPSTQPEQKNFRPLSRFFYLFGFAVTMAIGVFGALRSLYQIEESPQQHALSKQKNKPTDHVEAIETISQTPSVDQTVLDPQHLYQGVEQANALKNPAKSENELLDEPKSYPDKTVEQESSIGSDEENIEQTVDTELVLNEEIVSIETVKEPPTPMANEAGPPQLEQTHEQIYLNRFDHQKILDFPEGTYILQLAGLSQESVMKKFISEYQQLNDLLVYQTQRQSKDWYIVLMGPFQNRDDAKSHISSLPKSLQKQSPWSKPTKAVQEEIKINQKRLLQ